MDLCPAAAGIVLPLRAGPVCAIHLTVAATRYSAQNLCMPHLHAWLCGIHITSYGRAAWCASVARDKRPGSVCLLACLPEYGGMLRKTKAGLKGFLDSTSWAYRFRHRPTVGQHWSEWAALRLVTVFNVHPKLLQVI